MLATLSLSTLLLGPPVQRPSDAPLTRFLIETVEIQRITQLAVRGLVSLELRLP